MFSFIKRIVVLVCLSLAFAMAGFKLFEKKKTDFICMETQSGDLGSKHCFDALSSYKDMNVVKAVHSSTQDLHNANYAEFKNPVKKNKNISLSQIKSIERNCKLEKVSDKEFHIQAMNENPCFTIELPEDSGDKNPFLAMNIVLNKTQSAFKISLYTEENNSVAIEESSGWNSFAHEFSSEPKKGDIVFVEDEYRFTVGEDQDQGLEFNRSRSIHHGVGSWPGTVGRRITLIRKHTDRSQILESDGVVLESKRYTTDAETVLRIHFRKGQKIEGIKWGLLVEALTSPIQIKSIELSTPRRLIVNKRFVFLNPDAYHRFLQSSNSQNLLSAFQTLEPGFF